MRHTSSRKNRPGWDTASRCASEGKRRFNSPKAARHAMRVVGNRVVVYECGYCFGYHVTSRGSAEG